LCIHTGAPMMRAMHPARVRQANDAPARPEGMYVLYWMTAAHRPCHNFALDHAIALAREFQKPLVVLEAITLSYRWASDRLHKFMLEGMADNHAAFENSAVHHYPYVEPVTGAGRGLFETLAKSAVVVVTDEFPCFFLPQLLSHAANSQVRCDAVDGNGIVPLNRVPREFTRAFDFRRFLAKEFASHARSLPKARPLQNLNLPQLRELPDAVNARWPRPSPELLTGQTSALARLSIDHAVRPGHIDGGYRTARRTLKRFCERHLRTYVEDRNHPDLAATSELSPYLHFGHISAHEIMAAVLADDELSAGALEPSPDAQQGPFFQLRPGPAAFLDQLVTWRELGFNFCARRPSDYESYDSLPEWARRSLQKHEKDPREAQYSLQQLESASTSDPLWNAAQRQLVESGVMHNYLRMLWGKRVIEWAKNPRNAYDILVELNNKYALDGRDPNSYSGIGWCFGRYDRPWGPERPIFGLIRYMTSESARRKLRLKQYLERWGNEQTLPGIVRK
jgi:deoxyribodipyrimidine photo-lyase